MFYVGIFQYKSHIRDYAVYPVIASQFLVIGIHIPSKRCRGLAMHYLQTALTCV